MAGRGMDDLNRMLNNLYTAVFERPVQRFNRPFKNVLSSSESLILSEGEAGGSFCVPYCRLYEDLTATGAAYVPATGITSTTRFTYPNGVLDETAMWFAFRVRPQFASTVGASVGWLFLWANDANNRMGLFFDIANDSWTVRRKSGGAGSDLAVADSFASDDEDITVIAMFTATTLALSINGGAFTTVANSSIPTLTAATFDIGSDGAGDACDCVVYWAVAGVGALTDDDAADLHDLGNTDPDWVDLPGDNYHLMLPSFIWPAEDETHTGTRLGECIVS